MTRQMRTGASWIPWARIAAALVIIACGAGIVVAWFYSVLV